jgi:FkbM family methyltransferase
VKIFLDVGGHVGETVEAVLDPRFGFDRIYCFEPVERCRKEISRIKDPRVVVVDAGLLNETTEKFIYDPGSLGASVFSDYESLQSTEKELCRFMEAAQFFEEHINEHDTVYLKLNCEGSECLILENLIEKRLFGRIKEVLIDFDIRSVPSESGRQQKVLDLLASLDARNYHFPEEVQYGCVDHFGGIQNWLSRTGAVERRPWLLLRSCRFHVRNILSGNHIGYYKSRVLKRLPRWLVGFYYRKIKAIKVMKTVRPAS